MSNIIIPEEQNLILPNEPLNPNSNLFLPGQDFELPFDDDEIPELYKSEFVERVAYFEGQLLSFEDYYISKELINTESRVIVFIGGRQVSKSMTLSGDILGDLLCKPHYYILYYAPGVPHVRTFSIDRIQARTDESNMIKDFYIDRRSCTRNIHERSYTNKSRVYFMAESQLENIRGKSCHKFVADEAQDLTLDGLTVAERVLDGKKGDAKTTRLYAGTAKTIHTILESKWRESNQVYPIIKCGECGYHNVPNVDMVRQEGLSCKCGALVSVRPLTNTSSGGMYLKMMEKSQADTIGFWVPQIVLPLWTESKEKWAELYKNKLNYPPDRFLNEIMGISTGQGMLMITEADLVKCCQPSFDMWSAFRRAASMGEVYAGVDWSASGGRVSFTVLVIGFWHKLTNRFVFVYMKKFIGNNPTELLREMAGIMKSFRVKYIIADWGNGWTANPILALESGLKVMEIMYVRSKQMLTWDQAAGCYKMARTLSLLFFFKQIKANRIWFFKWEQFKPYAKDFLAEYAEFSEDPAGNELIKFDHSEEEPDDILQACNICFNMFIYFEDRKGKYFI